MNSNIEINIESEVITRIYSIRNQQVMLDEDLAFLYGVSTKRLNEQVKRNKERFPPEFCFQLTQNEAASLRSQFATSKQKGGRTYLPYAFTEQGVAMLSTVLRSKTAVRVSIKIMNAFVSLRKYLFTSKHEDVKFDSLERRQLMFEVVTEKKFDQVFSALSSVEPLPRYKLFYEGEFFDAHEFLSRIIKTAHKDIIVIDNYIDESVLVLLSKRKTGVLVTMYTNTISPALKQDVEKYNAQYPPVILKKCTTSHDRFLIIDEHNVYHFGASLKDLGKKWFACSKLDSTALSLLRRLAHL